MKIGYFPGCSLLGSSREYDESLRAVAAALDVGLTEIPDWNCCGASAAHNLNRTLMLALPARILAQAEAAGLEEVLVPCAACYSRLAATRHELKDDPVLRRQVGEVIELDYQGISRPVSILEWLHRFDGEILSGKIKTPFSHPVACYYGCLLVRPRTFIEFDRAEDPQSMDSLMRRIGADPVPWAFKVECCGAGLSVPRTDLVAKLCGRVVADAVHRGAETIIVACPMCHSNLDLRRADIEAHAGRSFSIPVLYITQALGLALGLGFETLGLHRHHVPVRLAGKEVPVTAGR